MSIDPISARGAFRAFVRWRHDKRSEVEQGRTDDAASEGSDEQDHKQDHPFTSRAWIIANGPARAARGRYLGPSCGR